MNDPQINAVTLSSGIPRNEREAMFQQTIKDLTQRNQTLAHKCSELQLALNAAVGRRNVAESERDCARQELAAKSGGANGKEVTHE